MSDDDVELFYFPYFVAKQAHATSHLKPLERGIYIALIERYWTLGSLMNDEIRLAQIARATPDEWASAGPAVLDMFQHDGDTLRHREFDRLKREQIKKYRQAVINGRKGVEARKRRRKQGNGHADGQPAHRDDSNGQPCG